MGHAAELGITPPPPHWLHADPARPLSPLPLKAARRRAITELLFFASVGDMRRCQRIVRIWNLPVSDPTCCDYDKRTPL